MTYPVRLKRARACPLMLVSDLNEFLNITLNCHRGKLGLLPKRPVSLLPDPAAGPAHAEQMTDEDDGLEYVENPFEDSRK